MACFIKQTFCKVFKVLCNVGNEKKSHFRKIFLDKAIPITPPHKKGVKSSSYKEAKKRFHLIPYRVLLSAGGRPLCGIFLFVSVRAP